MKQCSENFGPSVWTQPSPNVKGLCLNIWTESKLPFKAGVYLGNRVVALNAPGSRFHAQIYKGCGSSVGEYFLILIL